MTDLNVVVRAYSNVAPITLGLVPTPRTGIRLDHVTPIDKQFTELPEAKELSLSRYLAGVSRGDDSWVGLPIWLLRGFKHRSFWVRNDSELTSVSELNGLSLGLAGWGDTGNVWGRKIMQDEGVDLESVRWRLGAPIDNYTRPVKRPDAGLLPDLEMLPEGDTLFAAVVRGDLDAVSGIGRPAILDTAESPLRPLIADWPAAERAWFERTGLYPVFHTIGIRRDVFEANPDAAVDLCAAFRASWETSRGLARKSGDVALWVEPQLLPFEQQLGASLEPFGLDTEIKHRSAQTVADQLLAQGLISTAVSVEDAFAESSAALGLEVAGIPAAV